MANEQKTEAPERIWAIDSLEYGWISGFCTKRQPSEAIGTVSFEYTRTDLSQAAVGATVRACAEAIERAIKEEHPSIHDYDYDKGVVRGLKDARKEILALEPDDQQALDKLLAEKDANNVVFIENLKSKIASQDAEIARLSNAIENYRRAQFDVKGEDQEARKRAARTTLFAALEAE